MNYILKPSLQHLALVKVAATLWNQCDVKDLIQKFSIPSKNYHYIEFLSKWVPIEIVVREKVPKLSLPPKLKEQILCIIRPIGLQISKWKEFHHKGYNVSVDLPNEFFWTSRGTIDKKKTAEVMIKDQSIDTITCYKLACIYCLEHEIRKLWEKMPEDCKRFFYNQEDPIHVMQKELVVLWTYQINGEVGKMDSMIEKRMDRKCSPNQYAFELSAGDANRVATEYYLQKLTSSEREESLVKTAVSVVSGRIDVSNERTGFLREEYSDILIFLLNQLNEEQQLEVFKSKVLTCLLDWPYQCFFLQTAKCIWGFLDKIEYIYMFIQFTGHVIQGFKDFNYQKLFQEFWEQSPHDYKRYLLTDIIISRVVYELFHIGDIDNIKLILKDATPDDKLTIIYSDSTFRILKELLDKNWMQTLKYFIKECLPSKNEVVEFKEYFEYSDVDQNWQWKIMELLDDIICEFNKRKSLEGECSKAKRVVENPTTWNGFSKTRKEPFF